MYISRVRVDRGLQGSVIICEKLFSVKTDAFHNINVNSVFIIEIVCIAV